MFLALTIMIDLAINITMVRAAQPALLWNVAALSLQALNVASATATPTRL